MQIKDYSQGICKYSPDSVPFLSCDFSWHFQTHTALSFPATAHFHSTPALPVATFRSGHFGDCLPNLKPLSPKFFSFPQAFSLHTSLSLPALLYTNKLFMGTNNNQNFLYFHRVEKEQTFIRSTSRLAMLEKNYKLAEMIFLEQVIGQRSWMEEGSREEKSEEPQTQRKNER